MQLFDVAEGLKHQQIHAPLDQGGDLFAKRRARFLKRNLAQWLNADSQGTDRSGHPDIETLGCIVRPLGARQVDVAHTVGQAVSAQAKGVRAEGVGLNDLGASLQILAVDAADQFRLREVQLVIASIDEHALGIEQRAHGAIAQHGRLLQALDQIPSHRFENTAQLHPIAIQ